VDVAGELFAMAATCSRAQALYTRDRATGATALDVPVGATVNDVATRLGIPDALARVALVNGKDAGPERHLLAGDVVTLFPPLMGGE